MALTTVTSLSEAYLSEAPLIEKEVEKVSKSPSKSEEKEETVKIKSDADHSPQGLSMEEDTDKVRPLACTDLLKC